MIYDIWKCKKLYGFHYMEAALKVTRISGEIVDSRHYTKLAWGLLHLKQRFQRLMRQWSQLERTKIKQKTDIITHAARKTLSLTISIAKRLLSSHRCAEIASPISTTTSASNSRTRIIICLLPGNTNRRQNKKKLTSR